MLNRLLAEQFGAQVIIIHAADVGQRYFLRAFCFAGAGVGTVTKTFFVHLCNHGLYAAVTLWLALRQQTQLRYLGRYEQHSRSIFTGGNTCTATNTGSRVESLVSNNFRDRDHVGIRYATGIY